MAKCFQCKADVGSGGIVQEKGILLCLDCDSKQNGYVLMPDVPLRMNNHSSSARPPVIERPEIVPARPYFSFRGKQLEEIAAGNDIGALIILLEELKHRKSAAALALRCKVENRLQKFLVEIVVRLESRLALAREDRVKYQKQIQDLEGQLSRARTAMQNEQNRDVLFLDPDEFRESDTPKNGQECTKYSER